MQIKITHSDGYSWHSKHVGEVFDVIRVAHHMRGNKSYISFEVDLTGRHHDAIAGTIGARDCEVVDWTDAPQSMVVERLTAERDDALANLAVAQAENRALRSLLAYELTLFPSEVDDKIAEALAAEPVTPPAPSGTGR